MPSQAYEQGVTLTGKVGPAARAPIHLTAEAASPLGTS